MILTRNLYFFMIFFNGLGKGQYGFCFSLWGVINEIALVESGELRYTAAWWFNNALDRIVTLVMI